MLWRRWCGWWAFWCRRPPPPAVELRWSSVEWWPAFPCSQIHGSVVYGLPSPAAVVRRCWRGVSGGADQAWWSPAASTTVTAAAKRRGRAGGTSARFVQRLKFRRGAAEDLGGVFQGRKSAQALVRRWSPFVVFLDAGAAAVLDLCSASSPSYCTFLFLIYVRCMWIGC